jgi:hypothetical protein
MADKSYAKTPLYEANKMMRQPTGKTFHDWARIRPAPFQDYFLGNINALTSTVTFDDFEDAISSYFADKIKTRDPDKLFPRETRIELLKAELKNKGSTNKPEGYDQSANNAGYKFWAHNSFEFRPNSAFQFKSRIIQHPGFLYFKETEKSQKEIVRKYKKVDDKSEGPFPQAPVTSVENSFIDFLEAHIYRAQSKNGNLCFVHRGRDETYARLAVGISSSFAKQLVTDIMWKCPTCIPRMKELSEAGKAREKERSKKRKAEHTGEEKPTKKKQKKQKKKLAETSPPAETTPIQQTLQINEFENCYYQQPAPEYQQDDFSDIFQLQSAQEHQVPQDNGIGYSNLLAPSEPTPLSQDSQIYGPGDVRWVNYQGYGYYYLHCPPNHRLHWSTITMNYLGTVEIKGLGESEKHTPDYDSLPVELFAIPLPPGIYFYNNPEHPVFIDPSTNTVPMNSGLPIETTANAPSMQTVAGSVTDIEQVQLDDFLIDPATIYATEDFEISFTDSFENPFTESFENPFTDPSNNNVSEIPAHDNSILNIDPQLSSSSGVSNPSLANPYANLFEPFGKGLNDQECGILHGLNNFFSGSSYVPNSDFVQEDNMNFFNQQLPSNSDTHNMNSNISGASLVDFQMDFSNQQLPSSIDTHDMNSNISGASPVDFQTKTKETADAKPSRQCPTSRPIIDPSGRFSSLNGFTFPIPASSRA